MTWNEQYHGQEWRTGWETVQNRYLEMVNSPVRVDLRSYEKQGLDIIPAVHMGAAVTQMERRGIQTNIGNLNRDIKAANRMMSVIRSTIQNLRDWISDILEARKELLAEKKPETASPDLINLLRDYLNLRKAERRDWSRYGQQKGATKDLQSFVDATNYLKDHEIFTLEQLDSVLEEVKQKSGSISTGMKKAESRMKVITGIQNAVADCQQHKAIHDKYVRIGWKTVQSVYAESHRDELDAYNKAYRFLKKHGVDLTVDLEALQAEYEQLQTSHAEYTGQLAAVQEELKPLKEIRYWVSKVLAPEQAEVKKKPEPKHSVTEQIQDYREESRKKDEQHRQEKKTEYGTVRHLIFKRNRVPFVLSGGGILNVFEVVKQNVTTRQAAELYGISVSRNGMAVCPFHNDKNPSMKLDRRFHCFGCQADGDAADFVSRLFQLPSKEAAMKLADDFGIAYDNGQKPTVKPHIREPTPEQKYRQEEMHCYKVLCEYFHLLQKWEQHYAPQTPEDDLHPLFVEALQRKSYTEYLLDSFLDGSPEERRELVAQQGKEVMKLEQRIAEWTAAGTLHRGTGQEQPGTDRER